MTSEEYKAQLSESLGKLAGVHCVGEEYIRLVNQTVEGGLDYLGQTVTRAMYADLWAWVQAKQADRILSEADWQAMYTAQNGNVPYYSSGDGSTTFRLPRVVGYFKGAGTSDGAGEYTKEGLPNITGQLSVYWKGDNPIYNDARNAFTIGPAQSSDYADASGSRNNDTLSFSASRSNPIYGNSQHVTPETMTVVMGVYAFGVAGTIGDVQAAGMAEELTHKADVDASNFSAAGKSVLAGAGMPSGRTIYLSVGSSGASYTAPENGWFYVTSESGSASGFIAIYGQTGDTATSNGGRYALSAGVPCLKGNSVIIWYNSGANIDIKFTYANAEEA